MIDDVSQYLDYVSESGVIIDQYCLRYVGTQIIKCSVLAAGKSKGNDTISGYSR